MPQFHNGLQEQLGQHRLPEVVPSGIPGSLCSSGVFVHHEGPGLKDGLEPAPCTLLALDNCQHLLWARHTLTRVLITLLF